MPIKCPKSAKVSKTTKIWRILADISGLDAYFSKPIFALKPWAYHIILNGKIICFFIHFWHFIFFNNPTVSGCMHVASCGNMRGDLLLLETFSFHYYHFLHEQFLEKFALLEIILQKLNWAHKRFRTTLFSRPHWSFREPLVAIFRSESSSRTRKGK